MYNIAISLGMGLLGFALGSLAGPIHYGFLPAILFTIISYFLISRRISKRLQGAMGEVGERAQKGDVVGAKQVLKDAMPLARWQPMVGGQIRAQLGALDYMQRRFKEARPYLEGSSRLNWQSRAMWACLELREGRAAEGAAILKKSSWMGRKDPLYWGLLARLHMKAGDNTRALEVLSDALEVLPESKALKELQVAIANGRQGRYRWEQQFGQSWFSFFPEEATPAKLQRLGIEVPGMSREHQGPRPVMSPQARGGRRNRGRR